MMLRSCLSVLFVFVLAVWAKSKPPVKPPFAADTNILGHKLWHEYSVGDPGSFSKRLKSKPSKLSTEPKNSAPLRTGFYHIQNLYGCHGESGNSLPPSGGRWNCFKYVGKTKKGYLALYGDRKDTWEVIRISNYADESEPRYIIRHHSCNRKKCDYWYDDPDDSGDWLSLTNYKDTVWQIIPRDQGWRIVADHHCSDCKKDVTWKGSGIEWKYLYVGNDEGADFDFIPARK